METPGKISDRAALTYLRFRRATYFFGDIGPDLPRGTQARWRRTIDEPQGWQANMVGFIEGPASLLGAVVDIASDWFSRVRADIWVDIDEFTPLFARQDILEQRGFHLSDNWDVMVCTELNDLPRNDAITVQWVELDTDLQLAAWVAEQNEQGVPLALDALPVRRRLARYRDEYRGGHCRFVLAWLDGQAVGTGRVTNERVPVVVGIATLPEGRNRGVATRVTACLSAYALQQHGIGALYVEHASQAADIYSRLGYRPLFRTCAWMRPFVPLCAKHD